MAPSGVSPLDDSSLHASHLLPSLVRLYMTVLVGLLHRCSPRSQRCISACDNLAYVLCRA